MVDVSDKQITKRTAVAHSSITVNETIYKQISNNTNTKGNVLNTAQIALVLWLPKIHQQLFRCVIHYH